MLLAVLAEQFEPRMSVVRLPGEGYQPGSDGYILTKYEDIARVVQYHEPIANLSREGNQFQWGGERLCEHHRFPTPDGKAHFLAPEIPSGEGMKGVAPIARAAR